MTWLVILKIKIFKLFRYFHSFASLFRFEKELLVRINFFGRLCSEASSEHFDRWVRENVFRLRHCYRQGIPLSNLKKWIKAVWTDQSKSKHNGNPLNMTLNGDKEILCIAKVAKNYVIENWNLSFYPFEVKLNHHKSWKIEGIAFGCKVVSEIVSSKRGDEQIKREQRRMGWKNCTKWKQNTSEINFVMM